MSEGKKKYCLPKLRSLIDDHGLGVGAVIDESKHVSPKPYESPSQRTWRDGMKTDVGVSRKMAIRIEFFARRVFSAKGIKTPDELFEIVEVVTQKS